MGGVGKKVRNDQGDPSGIPRSQVIIPSLNYSCALKTNYNPTKGAFRIATLRTKFAPTRSIDISLSTSKPVGASESLVALLFRWIAYNLLCLMLRTVYHL